MAEAVAEAPNEVAVPEATGAEASPAQEQAAPLIPDEAAPDAPTVVAPTTEPFLPKIFTPLLDEGVSESALPLWMVPTAGVGIFVVRVAAFFVYQ